MSAITQIGSRPSVAQLQRTNGNPTFISTPGLRPFSAKRLNVKTFNTVGTETQAVEEAIAPAAVDATAVAESAAESAAAQKAQATELVDRLVELVKDTDSGDSVSKERRLEINNIIRELASIGAGTRPLESPLIWGNYNVAYVSQGNAQGGPPAGGRFRTGVGKLLLKTTRLCQSVLQPDVVTNKIEASLFGCLPVAVGLRGTLVAIPQQEDGPNELDTVKVFFEPPELELPGGIATRFGPASSVVLTTTYLDERVRIGKGSRGSLFVFTRGGESDLAGMDLIGTKSTTPLGAAILWSCIGTMVVGGGYAMASPTLPMPAKAAGLVSMLMGTALASVFMRGGVVDPNTYDRPEVQKN